MIMLTYYYDKEADVFYFSQGTPKRSDETVEMGNDVIMRVNARTKKARGFTLLNASRRMGKTRGGSPLPFVLSPILK